MTVEHSRSIPSKACTEAKFEAKFKRLKPYLNTCVIDQNTPPRGQMIGQVLVVQRRPKSIRYRLNRRHFLNFCVCLYSLTRPWFDFSFWFSRSRCELGLGFYT